MSNPKNMPQDLVQKLSEVKTPRIHTPEHKKMLKKELMQSVYFQKPVKGKFLKGLSLFANLKPMYLKKIIPVSVLALLIFTIFGQNYLARQNTVYAQELLGEVIEKVQKSVPESEEEKELSSALQVLEEAKKSGELKYLGEEVYPEDKKIGLPERRFKKFTFTAEDLSNDIVIDLENNKKVHLGIDSPLGQILSERFDLQVSKDGEIINIDELRKKLKDPNLTKPWLKELVKKNNAQWLRIIKRYGQESDASSTMWDKILAQLASVTQDGEVLIQGFGGGYDPETQQSNYNLSLYAIGGQKAKNVEAQAQIQKGIEKLVTFDTESARKKMSILKKALSSSRLKRYPNAYDSFLSFPYPGVGANEELYIRMNFKDPTENFLELTFTSEAFSVTPGEKGEWIDVEVENGQIAHFKELQQKLQDPNLKDELLLFIIQSQNRALIESIKKHELNQGGKGANPNLTSAVFKQFEELLSKAQVPVIERSEVGLPSNKNLLYSLGIYPMGTPQKTEASKVLDETIEKLKASVSGGKEAKMQFLKEAQKAKDLKYEGEEELSNGEKVEKLSFSRGEKRVEVLFNRDEGSYRVVGG
jgi:hypothetical protein